MKEKDPRPRRYDVAAYVWPAYTGDEPRTRIFWPEGVGEWQSVKTADAKFAGHTWPRRPLWGYVNEADPAVMAMEIDAAADHGVNVFIYDWYWYDRRPFLEVCLNEGFLKAANRARMKFYLMWANHDATSLWDKRTNGEGETVIWRGDVERSEFEKIARRLTERYFSLPEYYTIDGKPVFMIYDSANFVKGLGGIDNARAALDWWRDLAVRSGFSGLHFQMTFWHDGVVNLSGVDGARTADAYALADALGYDSATHYQFVHFTDIDRDYDRILPDVIAEWEKLGQKLTIPYFPHVSMGWDNNPRFAGFRGGIVKNNSPAAIRRALLAAKAYLDARPALPPLVTLNSWNEWTETSYLEPDDFNGYGYLDAVRDVFLT